MEIEKKFLVRKLPENLTQYSVKHMEQGYLCTDPVLRIRKSNDRYILTYKSRIGLEVHTTLHFRQWQSRCRALCFQ